MKKTYKMVAVATVIIIASIVVIAGKSMCSDTMEIVSVGMCGVIEYVFY